MIFFVGNHSLDVTVDDFVGTLFLYAKEDNYCHIYFGDESVFSQKSIPFFTR
jgi:hypothetical protein